MKRLIAAMLLIAGCSGPSVQDAGIPDVPCLSLLGVSFGNASIQTVGDGPPGFGRGGLATATSIRANVTGFQCRLFESYWFCQSLEGVGTVQQGTRESAADFAMPIIDGGMAMVERPSARYFARDAGASSGGGTGTALPMGIVFLTEDRAQMLGTGCWRGVRDEAGLIKTIAEFNAVPVTFVR